MPEHSIICSAHSLTLSAVFCAKYRNLVDLWVAMCLIVGELWQIRQQIIK
jgi:hypothetical protein